MTFLRRVSTRRLIAICALALTMVIGATAVAFATSGGGPKPPAKPLANAVHDALEAPSVPGISAEVHFTNNLIDASSLEGKDPLLAGADGRLWYSPSGGGKLRLELQAEEGGNDSQVLIEGRHFRIYDGTSETVYEGTLPEEEMGGKEGAAGEVPSVGKIQSKIDEAGKHVELSGAMPSDVAGQATYTLSAAPSHDGGLLGRVELAWDAANGIPLRAAVYSSESSSPVLQLEATEVSFESIGESVFEISPPAEAKVVDLSPEEVEGPQHGKATEVVGTKAVGEAVDFPLAAPQSLAGLPQSEVRAIEVDGKTAALVTYGKGLGGIAVIESKSEGESGATAGEEGGLGLPKIAIGNVKGEELDTALGSALSFSRERRRLRGRSARLPPPRSRRRREAYSGGPQQVQPDGDRRSRSAAWSSATASSSPSTSVDLTVEAGDVFGYLGPNGAGKTTSLRMMLGLIRPTEGTVRIFGRDPQLSVNALEGVAGFVEAPSFYPVPERRREPAPARGARRRRRRRADRRVARGRRPHRPRQGPGRRLLARDAPAARHRRRAAAQAAPAAARRARDRARPGRDARHARPDPSALGERR